MWIQLTNKFHLCPENVDSSLYKDGYIHILDAMTGKCGYVPIYSKLRIKHIEY